MKTKSQILKEVETRCNATIFESTLSVCVIAMQEHTDQAITAYKLKLKEKINEMSESPYDHFESNDNISADAVIELIDTTTI